MRVIKTVWDALADKYKTLELGTKKTNITDTIKSLVSGGSVSIGGGGGSSGTNNYNELTNKPQIEGVTLTGNSNFEDLNLLKLTNTEIESLLTQADL